MKQFLAISIVLAAMSSSVFAATPGDALSVKDEVSAVLMALKGANSVGTSQCLVGTDKELTPGTLPPSEDCIQVGFINTQSMLKAKAAFKAPLEVQGVFIGFKVNGVFKAQ